MGLNMEIILEQYGGLGEYHNTISGALYALAACAEVEQSDEEKLKEWQATLENHISVLGGLLMMGCSGSCAHSTIQASTERS